MYVDVLHVPIFVYHVCAWVPKKRVSDSVSPEQQTVVSHYVVLGSKLGSSGRTT